MKKSLIGVCVATMLQLALAPGALAGTQQERMKTCNKDAKTKALKGDARKAFMKSCLSTRKPAQATAKPVVGKKDSAKP